MRGLSVLDGWLYYKDPSLPPLSSLAYLFLAIVFSSALIALDLGKRKTVSFKMGEASGFTSVAMIGCGSMGGGLALLLAENGVKVSLQDPSEEMMDGVIEKGESSGYHGMLAKSKGYKSLCASLSKPRLFIFSIPAGSVADKVLDGLLPHLFEGDIILDCGNEHFENTERRQGRATKSGVRYIGSGVSGGYQSARAGPSFSPGGDESAVQEIMPLLETIAAKDDEGRPCVGYIGKGGAGHYVKMLHNGIEHGMMSAICEAWGIMRQMGLGYEEIGDVLKKWNQSTEFRETFLIGIGADLSHKHEDSAGKPAVISEVLDKVVQDVTGEEGTGIWSNTQAIDLHVPAFTLNIAHAFRLASAFRGERLRANNASNGGFPSGELTVQNKDAFTEDLRKATYAACLASFIQGINVISRADQTHEWDINYGNVWKMWRAGCIIQSDYISKEILGPVLNSKPNPKDLIFLYNQRMMEEVRKSYPSLRRVVAKAVETDQVIPALSSTLEYFKVVTGTDLPTSFYDAELDYFGSHMFDKKGEEGTEKPEEGKHHFEWKPAKSQKETYGKSNL
ncbi:6-phosphogluconate dehydrogenase-like protein [Sporormia fimetaria CBS 119925]|uniref:phosphogluconate dehydrogenase (NADP(+)-dependent, decarboxylating) n=1 Tax=Sporormia fimetaria CBS 119925 TaxID=1340428 RepID=A0A6A6V1S2_9PLEO|nr:6-phosphogluconate dehydrogenase-like protein [Sporormia fimetaria CBS 119925]